MQNGTSLEAACAVCMHETENKCTECQISVCIDDIPTHRQVNAHLHRETNFKIEKLLLPIPIKFSFENIT
jgi:hypothetical protein